MVQGQKNPADTASTGDYLVKEPPLRRSRLVVRRRIGPRRVVRRRSIRSRAWDGGSGLGTGLGVGLLGATYSAMLEWFTASAEVPLRVWEVFQDELDDVRDDVDDDDELDD